ncbi:hypothetical protein COL08_23015 [Priestia megaterium]|uniref:hypothetical protein n=1 Tax=Priestia megaterium TaxID=1404 RepID=UPI000BFA9565|nr:hypothetical protein [Priestia megaterium]PFV93066.1 hypothetical protein COL08_23015 [Priestia megaterium]
MKQFILVAGVDYYFKGVDFRIYCENRMKRILAKHKIKEELTFKIFDFGRGEIITHLVTYLNGKQATKTSKLTPSPYKKISIAHYNRTVEKNETHYHFKDGQRDSLSIMDIYKEVQQIGISDAGTLMELSFFSHAGMGGPVLVNSFDDRIIYSTNTSTGSSKSIELPSGARDPDDMDPRVEKDFILPTMDDNALSNFQKAYHPDGYNWIWGCAFFQEAHEILHKIEQHPSYKEKGLTGEEVFVFSNLNPVYIDILEGHLLPVLGAPFPNRKKIEIKFKYLKYFFAKLTVSGYSFQIAKNSKKKTYGGVIGTYSALDEGPLPLMSVYKRFVKHFNFYKNYLGFSFDREDRMYGEYNHDFKFEVPKP